MGTNYYRALTTPLTPVILAGIALGYDAARLTLAAPTPSDAPIAYYMVANLTTGLTTKVVAYPSTTLSVMGLQPQTSYSFQVSAVSIDGSSSTSLISPTITTGALPVVVVAPAAAAVAITRASVGTARRTAFTTQPQITIQDSGGNTVTSSSAVVTATVSAGGTLVGTTTATASSGVATFTDLGVDGTIGATYTITYTVSGLTIATATVTLSGTTCDGSFTCQVGDTGPGGGKIFYVASTFFTQVGATGSMCTTTCKYLEAAPNTWSGGSLDPAITWSTGSAVTGADGTVIGTGYQNSLDIVAQTGNLAASSAAVAARAYTGGSKNDWFLPSKDELAQLYAQKTIVGGFVANGLVWSSSELAGDSAWFQEFGYGGSQGSDGKNYTLYVRPVRAF